MKDSGSLIEINGTTGPVGEIANDGYASGRCMNGFDTAPGTTAPAG